MSIRKKSVKAYAAGRSSRYYRRRGKRIYLNMKSCTALLLSAALFFVSVDGIQVRAEEPGDQILEDEGNPDITEGGEGTTGEPSDVTTLEEVVKIASFKPIENTHIELSTRKTLEKLRAEVLPKSLNVSVYVNGSGDGGDVVDETVPGEDGDNVTTPDEGEDEVDETAPGEGEGGETVPGGGEGEITPGKDGTDETVPGEGEGGDDKTTPDEDEGGDDKTTPDEGEGGDDKTTPDEGEGGDDKTTPDEGDGGDGGTTPDEENGSDESSTNGGESGSDGKSLDESEEHSEVDVVASVKTDRSLAVRDEHQWRLLVDVQEGNAGDETGGSGETGDKGDGGSGETGDKGDGGGEGDGGSGETGDKGDGGSGETGDKGDGGSGETGGKGDGGSGETGGKGDGGSGETGDKGDGGGEGDGGSGETPPDLDPVPTDPALTDPAPDAQPVQEDPVVTEAEETLQVSSGDFQWECKQDYENTELTEYKFYPALNDAKWSYEGDESALPTITISYLVVSEVSTEEELANAFAAGVGKITLKNNIALTKPLMLPATANIELDGQGHSLTRYKAEDGSTFLGTMIRMDGEGYTRDIYGVLTLKNVTVDGTTDGNRAGAPAIMDSGSLTLDEGAVVLSNYNYGTSGGEGIEEIADFGGGIRVYGYGRLTVTQNASVTQNFADQQGGGVHLGTNTILYLYADVIKGNSVPSEEDGGHAGYGADIYADSGSTIYYDPSIDITREGFYTCKGAQWLPLRKPGEEEPAEARDKEVYINVSEGSGYSEAEVLQLRNALMELGYTVISNRIYIDPTNLEDWYVYDHYDTAAWKALGENWEDVYGTDNPKRKEYWYTESTWQYLQLPDPAYTIEDWIQKMDKYGGNTPGRLQLAQFKEHIYSRKVDGYPAMTFAGYGSPAYVDFLFYDPESNGEKVVNFDVDSSQVYTHTLTGSGFLVNTKVENNCLYGYLVYYKFSDSTSTTRAESVSIYRVNGIDCDKLHNGSYDFKNPSGISILGAPLATATITAGEWENQMSIQVKASPKKIEVRQQPKSAGTNIDAVDAILTCNLQEENAGSAYGPLVAYTGHGCSLASAFTYSNLQMYYTDASQGDGEEEVDMLSPLEKADFTQSGTQKYFINLFGTENRQYGDSATKGQYQEYLNMMQQEGIALITDRKTPFADYLGQPGGKDSNLYELEPDGGKISVDLLVQNIKGIIDDKNGEDGPKSTSLKEKLSQSEGDGGLKRAETGYSVGNIWLKSIADGRQFRELYDIAFGEEGFAVQVMDDITNYYYEPGITVTYEISKPRRGGYAVIVEEVEPGQPCTFVVGKDKSEWPLGQYTVRQKISNGRVYGYAYFNLLARPDIVDPPAPEPQPPAPDKPAGPAPESSEHSESSESSESPVISEPAVGGEYIEATVEMAAGEPTTVVVPAPQPAEEPKEKKPGEPKTGDMPIPALPVSLGACTAFMMKLRLWLYELEMGISEEKKNEMLRALISWAKDTTMLRVYLAIAATAVVLTVYHLLKAADEKRKQVVALFER